MGICCLMSLLFRRWRYLRVIVEPVPTPASVLHPAELLDPGSRARTAPAHPLADVVSGGRMPRGLADVAPQSFHGSYCITSGRRSTIRVRSGGRSCISDT